MEKRQSGYLLEIAVEALVNVLQSQQAKFQSHQMIVNDIGPFIVSAWLDWLTTQPAQYKLNAIIELADIPSERARKRVEEALNRASFSMDQAPHQCISHYLTVIPRTVSQYLVLDPYTGSMTLPPHCSPEHSETLIRLLPIHAPPYYPGDQLPQSAFHLGELIQSMSFGPTFRGMRNGEFSESAAIQFCVDESFLSILEQQQQSIREMMHLSKQSEWQRRIIPGLELQMDHPTPHLVSEYQPGGDLRRLLASVKQESERGFNEQEVLELIVQITEGLQLLHESGQVYGCLHPSSVRIQSEELRLAHCWLGKAMLDFATSQGPLDFEQLSLSEQILLHLGAEPRLYYSPEVQQGNPFVASDDVYSLGVLWYQLLTGDIALPAPTDLNEIEHLDEISRDTRELLTACLASRTERPKNATDLLAMLQIIGSSHRATMHIQSTAISPEEIRASQERRDELIHEVKELLELLQEREARTHSFRRSTWRDGILSILGTTCIFVALFLTQSLFHIEWLLALFPLLVFMLIQFARRHLQRRSDKIIQDHITALTSEYQEEMDAWGGSKMLDNVELVREIVATFESESGMIVYP